MKTSTFLASMLFGSLAVAAPLQRRARLTKTEIITTTVFSTVTVYDDEPAPTSSQGLFYEQPPTPSSVAPSSTPYVAPPAPSVAAAAPKPSVQAPAPSAPAPQVVAPSVAAPAPAVTSAAVVVAPAPVTPVTPPVVTSAAAPVTPAPTTSNPAPSTGDAQHTDVDLTMYNGYGGKGACGTTLNDSDIFVALSKGVFGDSTYDVMTGDATDPWCKATIEIFYNGKTVTAPVVDRCAGCAGTYDVDLSPAAYSALGLDASAPGRFKASWSKVS